MLPTGVTVPDALDDVYRGKLEKLKEQSGPDFDKLYLGLLAFTAITGFTSPLTFLVIAFSGERAAVWTERLMARFLPKSAPAPSTKAAPAEKEFADKAPSAMRHEFGGHQEKPVP